MDHQVCCFSPRLHRRQLGVNKLTGDVEEIRRFRERSGGHGHVRLRVPGLTRISRVSTSFRIVDGTVTKQRMDISFCSHSRV